MASRSAERIGASILDAASSPVRLQILRFLSSKGPLQYSEIMFQLKLDPMRDAGKFVYHLRSLTEIGLVTLDKKTKKYEITELGRMVVTFARDLDEYVSMKRGKLYVRTSRLAMEEFHRSKIAHSLVVEAGVPQEIADEIAAESEDRLLRLRTIYLTAPLIREFVNAILIEKRLEEYRHKLTRLGMPVYDVTQLIRVAGENRLGTHHVLRSSAESVLSEYVLLECLPHKLADAHLSGLIHIGNLEDWALTPNEAAHDLRYFFRRGLPGVPPPRTLESALALTLNVLQMGMSEISGEQTIPFFNVLLSPFARGRSREDTLRALCYFLASMQGDVNIVNPKSGFGLTLDLNIPNFLSDAEAVGPAGKAMGVYRDFDDEAYKLTEDALTAFNAIADQRPPIQPHLLVRINRDALQEKRSVKLIEMAHQLAADRSIPYFELTQSEPVTVYSATGLRLTDDWTGHWDVDCVRTGSMDTIFLNLPRMAYEAKGNDEKFFMLLKNHVSLAEEGFLSKRDFVRERFKQSLLKLLGGEGGATAYFYEKNAAYNISFVGLREAVQSHTGLLIERDRDATEFALRIIRELTKLTEGFSKESGIRVSVSQRPGDYAAERLARLDMEQYGRSNLIAEGSRGSFYYSDMPTIPLSVNLPIGDRMMIEAKFQSSMSGGHLNLICVSGSPKSSQLMEVTRRAQDLGCRFLAYTSNYSACDLCNITEKGILPKCSRCDSDRLTYIGRSSYGLMPLNMWPEAKQKTMDERHAYTFSD